MDSALRGVSPALIKIDVEGYETSVLRGAQHTLSNESLHSVIMEINGSGRRYGYDDSALVETMESHGFREYSYHPLARTLQEADGIIGRRGNSIFVRDLARVKGLIARAPVFDVYGTSI